MKKISPDDLKASAKWFKYVSPRHPALRMFRSETGSPKADPHSLRHQDPIVLAGSSIREIA